MFGSQNEVVPPPSSKMFGVRGESKFEISTLSVNPTLRGWGAQVLDAKDCNFGFLDV